MMILISLQWNNRNMPMYGDFGQNRALKRNISSSLDGKPLRICRCAY
jgi:hypothetical protein